MPTRKARLKTQTNDSGLTFQYHDPDSYDAKIKERRAEVDVGDSRSETFEPSIYLSAWEDECFFKIHLPTNVGNPTIDRAGRVEYLSDKGINRFTIKPDSEDNDAFEWEIIFDSIPADNTLIFPIEHKGLDFFFQPRLTQEEIDDGCFRDENVVGSYALYHKTRKNNFKYKDGREENYGTGKFCHIYRAKLIDNNGAESWVKMRIDPILNTLTLEMNARWLNNAAYPVILDPDIGYTTGGSSDVSSTDFEKYITWNTTSSHTPTADGTLNTGFIFVNMIIDSVTDDEYSVAVYEKDATLGTSDKVADVNWTAAGLSGTQWQSAAFASGAVLNGVEYIAGFSFDNTNGASNLRMRFDANGLGWGDAVRKTGDTDMAWDATLGSFSSHNGRDYSVYASYDEDAGGISIDHTREVAVLTQSGISSDKIIPLNTLGQFSLDSIIPVSTLIDISMSSILSIDTLKSISAGLELNIGNDSERSFSREIPVLVDTEISLDRFMNIETLSSVIAFSTVKNLNIDWRVDSSHERFMNIENLSLVVAFSTVKNLNIDWRIDSSQDRFIPVDTLSLISFIRELPVSTIKEISDSLIMNVGSGKDILFSIDIPVSTLKSLSLTKNLPVEYDGQSVFGIILSNFIVRTPNINNFVVRTPNVTNLRKS